MYFCRLKQCTVFSLKDLQMYLKFLSFFFLVILSSSLSYATKPPKVPPKEDEVGDFFWRPATREIVKVLKNSMNESADPCDNFYEFACGNYGKISKYSPDRHIYAKLNQLISELLLNKMPSIVDSKVVNSTYAVMQSCLNYNRTFDMSGLFELLMKQYRDSSLREIFSYLATLDIQTSFRSFVDPKSRSEVNIKVGAPYDIFTIDFDAIEQFAGQVIKDEKLLLGVKEYAKNIVAISSSTTVDKSDEHHWIDIDGIANAMDLRSGNRGKIDVDRAFFTRLENLINETGEEVVRAHTFMKMTFHLATAASDVFEDGETVMDVCLTLVKEKFPVVLLTMIKNEFLPKELKDGAKEVFDNVLEAIVETLERHEWLGSSRYNAINKTRSGEQWIGLPDKYDNYAELDSSFEAIEIKEDQDFFNLVIELLRVKQIEKLGLLERSWADVLLHVDQGSLLENNAWNTVGFDLTVFTAGFLQPPFFHYRFPEFYRYGQLGATFGHEYGHGLAKDRKPGPYFTDGGVVSQSGLDEFARRADCLVDQFNNDTLVTEDGIEHKINGSHYLNENIADNSANDVAFTAYKKLMARNRRPKMLRELDGYTPDQLFFVSSAQSDCGGVKEEDWKEAEENAHAPNPIRVNGVRNSDDFAKAFECPVGSKMNPEKKCRLWD